jgi:hypothetical protein
MFNSSSVFPSFLISYAVFCCLSLATRTLLLFCLLVWLQSSILIHKVKPIMLLHYELYVLSVVFQHG